MEQLPPTPPNPPTPAGPGSLSQLPNPIGSSVALREGRLRDSVAHARGLELKATSLLVLF